MATLAAAAVRQARALTRVSSPQSTATLIHRRGLAGAAGRFHLPISFLRIQIIRLD